MLTHARAGDHGHPTTAQPVLFDGRTTGMAADARLVTPLTVQQEVPNLGTAQTAPQTQVNHTHEQGEGRAPGWQWGWMKKNIPFSPITAGSHKQGHYHSLRPEAPRGFAHPPGSGPGQVPQLRRGFRPFATLAQPTTVYNTAAHSPLAPWAEPV
jgi:hypothetical protein